MSGREDVDASMGITSMAGGGGQQQARNTEVMANGIEYRGLYCTKVYQSSMNRHSKLQS